MLIHDAFKLVIDADETVFDIGAFQGEISVFFANLVERKGRVYSFEPHPTHFLELAFRAARQSTANIFPHCRAMSDTVGHCPIFLAPPSTAQSSSIVPELGTETRLGSGVQGCLAETDTIDNFVRSHGCRPDVIKIDTEGAEQLVFAGGQRTIEHMSPTLVFEGTFGYDETCNGYCSNEPVPQHVHWLESVGYRMYLIDIDYIVAGWVREESVLHSANYGLLSITSDDFKKLPLIACNLLAVHGSNRESLAQVEGAVTGNVLEHLARLNIFSEAPAG